MKQLWLGLTWNNTSLCILTACWKRKHVGSVLTSFTLFTTLETICYILKPSKLRMVITSTSKLNLWNTQFKSWGTFFVFSVYAVKRIFYCMGHNPIPALPLTVQISSLFLKFIIIVVCCCESFCFEVANKLRGAELFLGNLQLCS